MSFTINLNGRDLDESIGQGFSFGVNVKGFWSIESINVYINRSRIADENSANGFSSAYKISVSHSSGGRDSKEVADDVEAEQYFGEALIGVTKFIREEIQPRIPAWERLFQEEERAAERADIEAAKEQQAKIDADQEVGEQQAKVYAHMIRGAVINEVVLYERGYANSQTISRVIRPSGQVHFINHLGARFTFNELVAAISRSSKSRLVAQ